MINVDIGSQSCTELSNKMASLYGLVDECFDKPNSEPWILPWGFINAIKMFWLLSMSEIRRFSDFGWSHLLHY